MVAKSKRQRRKLSAGKHETIALSAPISGSEKDDAKVKELHDDIGSAEGTPPVGQGTDAAPATEAEVGTAEGRKKRARSGSQEGLAEGEPGPTTDKDELLAAIEEHDRFFSNVLNMIPENLVLRAKEVPEAAYASKFMKNKKEEAPKQSKKEESKKNKRARYAAENQKTVLERQQERADEERRDKEGVPSEQKDDALEAGLEDEKLLRPEALREKGMDVSSMTALRQRIAERIKEYQQKRTAAEGSRRAKSAEKREKEKAAKREIKKKGSKDKKSKNKKRQDADAAEDATANVTGDDGHAAEAAGEDGDVEGVHGRKGATVARVKPELPPLPSVEDIGDIEFSGLQGVAPQSKKQKNMPPKVGAPGSKMRRLHGLLASAEEKKKRLEGLRQSEEGKEQAREEIWSDAMRAAGGEKLRDNPAALKKMIKQREKEKAKSAAQWKSRTAGVRKEQAEKQAKREENLKKRGKGAAALGTDESTDKTEKRQRRAGFEGKKQDFLNKEKAGSSAKDGGSGKGGSGVDAGQGPNRGKG